MDNTTPYLPLSKVVEDFCIASFNDSRKFFLNYLVHAKWIWKDLFQNNIGSVKSKYVKVDFSTNPPSILFPRDMVRFFILQEELSDGRLQQLVIDNTIQTVQFPINKDCEGHKESVVIEDGCECQPSCCAPKERLKMKVADGRIWLKGDVPTWLIISYQTNGECPAEEIMVPEYAVNAMDFGISWRSMALSGKYSRSQKDAAKDDYEEQKEKLDQFLMPINMDEFMAVQGIIPKWGSGQETHSSDICLGGILIKSKSPITIIDTNTGGEVVIPPPNPEPEETELVEVFDNEGVIPMDDEGTVPIAPIE